MRIQIPVHVIEFDTDGNTIWIQSPEGGTSMRIKCTGKILIEKCIDSPISHSDIIVNGNIDFCLSSDSNI